MIDFGKINFVEPDDLPPTQRINRRKATLCPQTAKKLELTNSKFEFDEQDIKERLATNIIKFCDSPQISILNQQTSFSVRYKDKIVNLKIEVKIGHNPDEETVKDYPLHYRIQITKKDEQKGKVIYSDFQAPQSAEELAKEIKRGAIELLSYDAAEARRAKAEALTSK